MCLIQFCVQLRPLLLSISFLKGLVAFAAQDLARIPNLVPVGGPWRDRVALVAFVDASLRLSND